MRAHFLELKNRARKSTTPGLIIYQENSPQKLFAVVVSKKVHPKASARNIIKRALKQALLNRGRDTVVVIVKPKPHPSDEASLLRKELEEALGNNV